MAGKTLIMHPLLWPWCEREGKGARSRLARAAHITWPAVDRIVRGGGVPRYDTAKAFSALTGYSIDEIITAAQRCRDEARNLGEAAE